MWQSTLSRRISEFVGVALFALALIWLIALVTYEPTDPVWFFTTDAPQPPANFVGPCRRLPRRAFLPAVRLRGLSAAGVHRHRRLALLLVSAAGCGLHQAVRRHAVLRAPARF